MKKIIFILAAIEATFSLRAQTNIDDVLKAVEQNNTTLQALRQTADAQKLENRTGLTLPDPEDSTICGEARRVSATGKTPVCHKVST